MADAGPVEGLHPWVALWCLAAVILAVLWLCILRQKHDIVNQIPMQGKKLRDEYKAECKPVTNQFRKL